MAEQSNPDVLPTGAQRQPVPPEWNAESGSQPKEAQCPSDADLGILEREA